MIQPSLNMKPYFQGKKPTLIHLDKSENQQNMKTWNWRIEAILGNLVLDFSYTSTSFSSGPMYIIILI
ncbi:MAG: hypothetical protein COA38_17445 [Fluviicola sp.]|nr:MAG: hypothetical protein COA38_17445 [Fluviicola sp.]